MCLHTGVAVGDEDLGAHYRAAYLCVCPYPSLRFAQAVLTGVLLLLIHSCDLCGAYWDDPGDYEPAGWAQVRSFFFLWGKGHADSDGRSVITELTVGFMIPGKPIAMMMCVPLRFFFSLLCFVPFCFVLSARCGASGAWC